MALCFCTLLSFRGVRLAQELHSSGLKRHKCCCEPRPFMAALIMQMVYRGIEMSLDLDSGAQRLYLKFSHTVESWEILHELQS